VVRIGISGALQLAQFLHVGMLISLLAFGLTAKLGLIYYGAMVLIAGALVFEHHSARNLNIAGINRAFFQSNAFVSAIFVIAICLDRLI
jgi:4-hydroxybenzoate polyprenyltransferase